MFLENCWYMIAWSHEISREPMRRIVLNRPIVVYRKEDEFPVALEDRCVHKSIPLSLGTVIGDRIQCRYHGMEYDCTGQCVKIPGQENIPSIARITVYPVAELFGCIWVWIGDEAEPNDSRIPDFHWLVDDKLGRVKGYSHLNANYMLLNENLLDLSHIGFLHSTTVGSSEFGEKAEVEAETSNDKVRVSRWTIDVPPQPTYGLLGQYTGNVDRWQISEFQPPCHHIVDTGAVDTGTGAPEGKKGTNRVDIKVCHTVTPEKENSSHYFWCVSHPLNSVLADPAVKEEYYNQQKRVISEDVEMMVAQQEANDTFGTNVTNIMIKHDIGVAAARKIMTRLLEQQEQGLAIGTGR